MIFTSFLNWSIYLFLLYEYLKNKFPKTTDDILINVTYYSIYLFSKLQIYLKNNQTYVEYLNKTNEIKEFLISIIRNFINAHYKTPSQCNKNSEHGENGKNVAKNGLQDTLLFEFIVDNKIDFVMSKKELIEKLESSELDNELLDILDFSNFALISDSQNNIKIIDTNQLTLANITSEDSELLKITPVSYKPILCEMIVDSKIIKINFSHKDGEYNYLVEDNRFDYQFLQYFMKSYFNCSLEGENKDFELKILDDKVDTILIHKNDVLKIEKDKMIKV
jgi:hypothetical protein